MARFCQDVAASDITLVMVVVYAEIRVDLVWSTQTIKHLDETKTW